MRRYVDMETDIFLFNIPRCFHHLSGEYYRLFESIKDGKAMVHNTKKMRFTTPNVLIVFFSREPDRSELSEDRLIILKISEDLMGFITDDSCWVKKKKKMFIGSDESDS